MLIKLSFVGFICAFSTLSSQAAQDFPVTESTSSLEHRASLKEQEKGQEPVSKPLIPEQSEIAKDVAKTHYRPRTARVWIGSSESDERLLFSIPLYSFMAFEILMSGSQLSSGQLCLGILGGYLGADFLAGMVHMIADNLPTTKGPRVIREFAEGFQEHHQYPYRVIYDSFWYQNREALLGGIPLLLVGEVLCYYGYYLSAFMFTLTTIGASFSHFIHACAHGRCSDSLLISSLQKSGIIINKERHHKHHQGEGNEGFCSLTGYAEPLVSFFYRTGRALFKRLKAS